MPKFHLIKDGVVVNTVLWAAPPPAQAYPGLAVIEAAAGDRGWLWNGATLSPPRSEPSAPPPSISRVQLILGMTQAGLITPAEGVSAASGTAIPALVEAVFARLPNGQATAARIRWFAMTEVERANPLVAAVAAAASKSETEMDQYFRDWGVL